MATKITELAPGEEGQQLSTGITIFFLASSQPRTHLPGLPRLGQMGLFLQL